MATQLDDTGSFHVRTRSRLALVSVLGLLTTIGVAWSCAATNDMFSYEDRSVRLARPAGVSTGPEMIDIGQTTFVGSRGWRISYEIGVQYIVNPPSSFGPPLTIPGWARPLVMPWESSDSAWPGFDPPRLPYAIMASRVRAHGWPLPALYSHWHTTGPGPQFVWVADGVLTIPGLYSPDGLWPRVPLELPFLPLVRGLLLDACIFALAWSVILFTPGCIRRARRRRRGRCVGCAYDLRSTPTGAPCPECGRPQTSPQPAG